MPAACGMTITDWIASPSPIAERLSLTMPVPTGRVATSTACPPDEFCRLPPAPVERWPLPATVAEAGSLALGLIVETIASGTPIETSVRPASADR
ncbi:hypothetical protein D3C71_1921030 [compost metagenome]